MLKKDSRKVVPGDTFVDTTFNKEYVYDAVKNGASLIISKFKYDNNTIIVDDPKQYYNEYIYNKYYDKIKDLTLIGITGTNGKTTTSYIIYEILNKMNVKCAYIGTIGFYKNNQIKVLNNTTPDIEELYEYLYECSLENIKYVVMEVSSHALDQDRVYGLKYDACIFTNLTEDHLDYHKNMDEYKKTKMLLFDKLRNKRIAIINSDDCNYKDFMFDNNYNVKVGKFGDYKIKNIKLNIDSLDLTFNFKKDYFKHLNLVGKYNAYNYLEAVATLNYLNFDLNKILEVDVFAPPGRMYLINYKNNKIFIDYAHTPDAMEKVLKSVNDFKKNKIITIFGCGGDRDKNKRSIMGNIASSYSDKVIITNDNPRNENENNIISDIVMGIKKENYEIIKDRKKAIIEGISYLNDNDILLILGKGHENYQIINGKKRYFSDLNTTMEIINSE
mgnify:CR=1 FL=1